MTTLVRSETNGPQTGSSSEVTTSTDGLTETGNAVLGNYSLGETSSESNNQRAKKIVAEYLVILVRTFPLPAPKSASVAPPASLNLASELGS